MSASISGIQKRRGRPATGRTGVMVKLLPDELARLDEWRSEQTPEPSRPEGIRRLMKQGLEA